MGEQRWRGNISEPAERSKPIKAILNFLCWINQKRKTKVNEDLLAHGNTVDSPTARIPKLGAYQCVQLNKNIENFPLNVPLIKS